MELKCTIKNIDAFRDSVDFVEFDGFKKSLKLNDGDCLNIDIWKERNVDFHRKFFAFLNACIYLFPEEEEYDRLRNVNYLRKKLMIMIGEADVIYDMTGKEHLQARSISFKSMDDVEFSRIYSMCIDAMLKHILHWISMEDFEKTIANFI